MPRPACGDSSQPISQPSAVVSSDPSGPAVEPALDPQRTENFVPDSTSIQSTTEPAGRQPAAQRERPLPAIEGYEVLAELGRGGMGVVYRARQILLNRPCALKMILAGAHADSEASVRFLAEAEAVARVQHPNVVQIHHVGRADGLPFLELEYVEGGSLDGRLDGTPWPPRRAAGLVVALAQGVAEAHRDGIVHRDLKPGNILMAAGDIPKITDFGLAKSLTAESGLTQTGQIMGSPSYMAPEQAAGKARGVGPLADVYALCAILYELLTGRPPFRGATVLDTLEQARTAEPVPPSRLVSGLPRDVETITLKGLRKEPGNRYDSAAALAADLQRFLRGESIVARPVGPVERSWRWCRRHPGPASLTAAVVLTAALGLTGVLWQWREAVAARDLAASRAIAEAEARRQVETMLVDMYTTSGILAGDQGEHGRAALWFANAARLANGDADRQRANTIRTRTWGRQAFVPRRALVGDGTWPGELVLHQGGHHLITKTITDGETRDATCTLWDVDAEQPRPFPGGAGTASAAVWGPNGRDLAVGRADGDVLVTRFPGGGEMTRIPFPGRVRLVSYSADGRYLAIAGGSVARVWDCKGGAFATPELVHPEAVTTLAIHPEGSYLATGCRDNLARLFVTGGDKREPLWQPVPHVQARGDVWYPQFFSPPLFLDGGRGLLTYGGQKSLSWRAVATGVEVRTLRFPETERGIAAAKLSPDGRHLAVFGVMLPGNVRVFEAATGRHVGAVMAHENTVFDVAFSPDSSRLVTSSSDGTARLWTVPAGKPVGRPLDLHRTIQRVAFVADGRSLVTQDRELIRVWALPQDGLPLRGVELDSRNALAVLSPDGTLAIPTGTTMDRGLKSTRAYRVATGEAAGPSLRPGGIITDAVFSPDGRSVAVCTARESLDPPSKEGQEVQVWDWSSGKQHWRAAVPSGARSVAYRPDGQRLAVLCAAGELAMFDADAGREVLRWRAHESEMPSHWVNNGKVGYSPDGQSLLIWGMGHDVRVFDADSGSLRYPAMVRRDKCHDLEFSPDGRLMALASYDHSVQVRDFATGSVVAELPAHPDQVYSARFSPDGRLLVTACRDRTVRVWDWRAGTLACPQFEHAKDATAAVFTPDGRWVVSVSVDGTARAWDWRSGKPITPPLVLRCNPLSVAIPPDGQHAVVGGFGTELALLDLGELARGDDDPDALGRWAELAAGQRIHEGGGTVNLSAAEWLDRWRTLTRHANTGGRSN